jgi:hypothetical protein
MAELKGGGTRRAVKKPIALLRLLIVVHAPSLPVPAPSSKVNLLFPQLKLGYVQNRHGPYSLSPRRIEARMAKRS